MTVEFNIPQFWQHLTDNVKVAEVDGGTVGECIEELMNRFPQLEDMLLDKDGKLPRLLNVYINKESAFPEELDKPVHEGDELHIMYTLVGG